MKPTRTLEDLLLDFSSSNVVRLKLSLMGLTKTNQERKIIEMLCEGYTKADIAKKLKVSRAYITMAVNAFKRRLTPENIQDLFFYLRKMDEFQITEKY